MWSGELESGARLIAWLAKWDLASASSPDPEDVCVDRTPVRLIHERITINPERLTNFITFLIVGSVELFFTRKGS